MVTRFFLLGTGFAHYVAGIVDAGQSVTPGSLKNPTRFSVLHIPERLESGRNQAVICLTVAVNGRDYSRSQGLQNRTRKYVERLFRKRIAAVCIEK